MNEVIAVVYGGPSTEAEVSVRSARNVHGALLKKHPGCVMIELSRNISEDLKKAGAVKVFLVTHGRPGEDGTVQGLLELLKIPYTHSGILASGLCLNKKKAKEVMSLHSIPLLKDVCLDRALSADITRSDWIERKIGQVLDFPVIVKPNSEGSSVGVAIVRDAEEWAGKVPALLDRFGCLLAERFVKGREVTAGVLERRDGSLQALPILELIPKNRFYDYEAKYTPGMTEFVVPAALKQETTGLIQSAAVRAFRALGCGGAARVDFIVEEDRPWVLEVNSIPGMTETSDLPKEAAAAGITFDELVETILATARIHGC